MIAARSAPAFRTIFAGPNPFRFLVPPMNYQDRVLALVRANPWCDPHQLVDQMDNDPTLSLVQLLGRVRNCLSRLTESGRVTWRQGVTEASVNRVAFRQYLAVETVSVEDKRFEAFKAALLVPVAI